MRSKSNHRLMKLIAIVGFCFMQFAMTSNSYGQCQPYIKVDGNMVIANSITATGLTLPVWLTSGQTLAADQMVQSLSVIEFTETATNTLEYSKVKKITTLQTVPAGKVWKVESIIKTASLSSSNGAVFSGAGTYSFTVPACASYICIEAWGSGGGGGGSSSTNTPQAGGGGGGYGQGCFSVSPGQVLSITIGAIGSNTCIVTGSTANPTIITGVGINMSVAGGNGGSGNTPGTGGSAITGCAVAVAGSTGTPNGPGGAAGGSPTSPGGSGGYVASSSSTTFTPTAATIPGGGQGGNNSYYCNYGGSAAPGRVSITW